MKHTIPKELGVTKAGQVFGIEELTGDTFNPVADLDLARLIAHRYNHFEDLITVLEQISKHKVDGKQSTAASVAIGALAQFKEVES